MTNTVLKYPGDYTNADGLQFTYPGAGVRDAVVGKEYRTGNNQVLVADIDWHDLPAFQSAEDHGVIYGGISNTFIPAGALIVSAILVTTEVFVGASATLSIGLVQADGTELDNDGLLDATATTAMDAVGETVTGAGALVGTILAATAPAYYLWATVQTATFTAGKGRLEVTYFMPTTNTPGGVPA